MPQSNEKIIQQAIQHKWIVTFFYGGEHRTCEPHVLGIANGRLQVLCWQETGGSSRGGIPEWRRFDLQEMLNLQMTREKFPGARPVPHPHSIWDQVILTV